MRVYLAADHAGFELKQSLIPYVHELGHEPVDCGAHEHDPGDDYPAFVAEAAQRLSEDVEQNTESRAIVIGASGQGEAIVANRFKGVRCALYYGVTGNQTDSGGKSLDMISSVREHNDSNALSLGARFLSESAAKEAVKKWLSTPFSNEERHARRIQQIDDLHTDSKAS